VRTIVSENITAYLLDQHGVHVETVLLDAHARMPERFSLVAPPQLEVGQLAQWTGVAWIVLDEVPAVNLSSMKEVANAAINAWRAAANLSTFQHGGKQISCDELSRSDIDGVANHIALFNSFPAGFPGGWKATDNSMIPLASVDAFRAMYASMTAQGAENFNHSQNLKAQLAAASTPEEIAAIAW